MACATLCYVILCYAMSYYVTTFCSDLSFTFTRALFSRILASAQDYETSLYPDHSYYCAVVMDPRETSLFMMFLLTFLKLSVHNVQIAFLSVLTG